MIRMNQGSLKPGKFFLLSFSSLWCSKFSVHGLELNMFVVFFFVGIIIFFCGCGDSFARLQKPFQFCEYLKDLNGVGLSRYKTSPIPGLK